MGWVELAAQLSLASGVCYLGVWGLCRFHLRSTSYLSNGRFSMLCGKTNFFFVLSMDKRVGIFRARQGGGKGRLVLRSFRKPKSRNFSSSLLIRESG